MKQNSIPAAQSKPWLYLLIIVLMVSLTYANHFGNSFHFDDSHTINNNIFIRDIANIPKFFTDGSTFSSLPSNQSYRPIVTTTLAIDYWLGGGLQNKFYFHLSTFLFFLAQLILMYFLYIKIFATSYKPQDAFYFSLFAVAWYGLHPANAETINYVIARSDSISTFFVVMALVIYIYFPQKRKHYLYLLPVFIGALAKPTAIMFAPLLLMYILLFEQAVSLPELFKSNNFSKLIKSIKLSIPAFVACLLFYVFTQKMEPSTWSPGGSSKFLYMITQPYIFLHYIYTFFLPLELSADTDWGVFQTIADVKAIVGLLGLLLLLFMIIVFSKHSKLRPVSFGIAWFLIALIPTSVVPLAEVMNDHRIFYPYVGWMIGVVGVLLFYYDRWNQKSFDVNRLKIVAVLMIVVLEAYAMGTYQRNEVWKNDDTLWKDVTIKSPNNARGLMNYGLTLMSKGNYAEAERYFQKGISLWPGYSVLYLNMAILKEGQKKPADAEQYYQKALSLGLRNPSQYFFYARYLERQGRNRESVEQLKKSLELSPAFADSRYLLMSIYAEEFDWINLKRVANETLQIMPGDSQALQYLQQSNSKKSKLESMLENAKTSPTAEKYLDLSLYYYQIQNFTESIYAAKEALKLKPDYAEAYNNICSANNELKNYSEAKKAGEQALKIKPDYQLARNNLNWTLSQINK